MRVFVNLDTLYERVLCVHTTEEGTCDKCLEAQATAEKNKSYHPVGEWFEVIEDKKKD